MKPSQSLRHRLFVSPRCFGMTLLLIATLLISGGAGAASSASSSDRLATSFEESARTFPWRQAGWTEREAAAHLLDRFTYGPKPGDVERVIEMGLEGWFERQLAADAAQPELDRFLSRLRTLKMTPEQIAETYPAPGRVLRMAQQEGAIDQSEIADVLERFTRDGEEGMREERARRGERYPGIRRYAEEQGFRPQRELIGELMTQKLQRALLAENQLAEVMTAFWFNHFYVSLADNDTRSLITSYERDAIRPFAMGSFGDLLSASARHPAMLIYLDNARSTADPGRRTTFDRARFERSENARRFGRGNRRGQARPRAGADRPGTNRLRGLNENYGRELLELHTLGVDGGYSQEDVVEVARAFSGWSTVPPGGIPESAQRRLAQLRRMGGGGFVIDGLFLFRADVHDAEAKTVLGVKLPAGRGIEDGEQVLSLLAGHPSTARHIARKLAVRFVSDDPPQALVDRLAEVFSRSRGDIRALLNALVESPEFWSPEVRRQKIKMPFELVASALRALDAKVFSPRSTIEAVSRLGEPLYGYQAPTGLPDRAEAWVNTGALLTRMNFGLKLASRDLRGIRFDLIGLNDGREPESPEDALTTYLDLLMPGRDHRETLDLLVPMIRNPRLAETVEAALPESDPGTDRGELDNDSVDGSFDLSESDKMAESAWGTSAALERVVGVILGSPEFQRR